MRVVHKYYMNCLGYDGTFDMPVGAKFLKFDVQNGNQLMAWFEVSATNNLQERRTFRVFGTGEIISDDLYKYRGTLLAGDFVWHLYELVPYNSVEN